MSSIFWGGFYPTFAPFAIAQSITCRHRWLLCGPQKTKMSLPAHFSRLTYPLQLESVNSTISVCEWQLSLPHAELNLQAVPEIVCKTGKKSLAHRVFLQLWRRFSAATNFESVACSWADQFLSPSLINFKYFCARMCFSHAQKRPSNLHESQRITRNLRNWVQKQLLAYQDFPWLRIL